MAAPVTVAADVVKTPGLPSPTKGAEPTSPPPASKASIRLPGKSGSSAVTETEVTAGENVMVIGAETPVPGLLWKPPKTPPVTNGLMPTLTPQ